MGLITSKPAGGSASNRKPSHSQRSDGDKDSVGSLYAELVGGSDFPPVKVLVSEQLTTTAVDSLKDSEVVVEVLAKNLVIDVLQDTRMPGKFGELLQYTFAYESILHPTRWLLYWSLNTKDVFNNTQSLASWHVHNWMHYYGAGQVSYLTQSWLNSDSARRAVVYPLILWTIAQNDISRDPASMLAKDSLPYCREATKEGLKYAVTESLKSEITKKAVKDTLLLNLTALVGGSANSDASSDRIIDKTGE